MNRWTAANGGSWCRVAVLSLLLWCAFPAQGHVGSPTVFFEGNAGPYPVRVVVRPPEVIPGLAEISVRAGSQGVERVTARPMRWNTGREGAPPPDVAERVPAETNLFSGRLWIMQGGAQSIEVAVAGRAGEGQVIIPVNAVATRVMAMPAGLGRLLAGLGLMLFALAVSIIGAAVGQSVVPAGAVPSRARRWWGRGATGLATIFLGLFLLFGNRWWKSEAANYRNNRLYRPLESTVSLTGSAGHPLLRLEIIDERFYRGAPLVPDHGKLMHLFLIREPGLDVFAHLHPHRVDSKTFETPLSGFSPGDYALYGDITFETGFSETLTAHLQIPAQIDVPNFASEHGAPGDPDDSWTQAPPLESSASPPRTDASFVLRDDTRASVAWLNASPLVAGRQTTLRFSVRDARGRPLPLDPYLGMAGHLVLRRDDGAVFTHIHPGGSFSMAAQRLFEMRAAGLAPLKVASATNDPICRLPMSDELDAEWRKSGSPAATLSFPYAFPQAGRYRLWMQVKVRGEILTTVFDADVAPPAATGT